MSEHSTNGNTAAAVGPTYEAKRRLIREALELLRAANAIDERETLDLERWIAWYDATIHEIVDLKVLAGAMEIELAIRRGDGIRTAGEQRGGDHGNQYSGKVTPGVTLPPARRMERSRDRRLSVHAEKVRAYSQAEIKARRIPTQKGALRAVTAETRRAGHFATGHTKRLDFIDAVHGAIEKLALVEGQQSDKALQRRITVNLDVVLRIASFIPWVQIDRTAEGTHVSVDEDLRAICEARVSRPELPDGKPVFVFLKELLREIRRRRKENNDTLRQSRWVPENVVKRYQTELLDWIETQLSLIPE